MGYSEDSLATDVNKIFAVSGIQQDIPPLFFPNPVEID
jgi:hypothetical protein